MLLANRVVIGLCAEREAAARTAAAVESSLGSMVLYVFRRVADLEKIHSTALSRQPNRD